MSSNIEENFTAQSFAYWFMDDGGKLDYTANEGAEGAMVLNTHNFSFDEVFFLNQMLIKKFELKSSNGIKKNLLLLFLDIAMKKESI